ncbi:helix-turn-helix transcriptional regulator [Cytobacillus spongiae]|jgi:DNA-binding HxlR family transcriptional regulator|uniref:winged helix-turn-helix transcriptional regulator n=1 Tax=Cytobacillus spongiae TaxID=2901381 RepID=UPI001F2D9842|nr:helix-turn-helix domain-containing protein [Cytobacillus spongiae]UII55379.1 helix-turn-helix transcriptional regulator [Cytobacillus spongiae]
MKKLYPEYDCSIDLVIDLIGGKWKVLILWNLNEGAKRFNELKRSLPGVTQKMLSQQLKELEEHGLVERTAFEETHVVYSTTAMGNQLKAVLFEMCKWGDAYAEKAGIVMNRCSSTYDFTK